MRSPLPQSIQDILCTWLGSSKGTNNTGPPSYKCHCSHFKKGLKSDKQIDSLQLPTGSSKAKFIPSLAQNMLVLFDFAAFLPSSTCKARSPSLNTEYANAEYPL